MFKTLLNRLFTEQHAQSLPVERIREFVNSQQRTEFSDGEMKAAIEKMTDENQIMEADGQVFLI